MNDEEFNQNIHEIRVAFEKLDIHEIRVAFEKLEGLRIAMNDMCIAFARLWLSLNEEQREKLRKAITEKATDAKKV